MKDSERRGRAAAADFVRREMASQRVGVKALASATGLDTGTISDFLAEKRWPILASQGAIEEALRLDAGSIERTKQDELRRVVASDPTVGGIRDGSPTAARAVGERATPMQVTAVREFIAAQQEVLAVQRKSLDALLAAFEDDD